jgi:Zn-dependent M28 family amino/carboxypeptidase
VLIFAIAVGFALLLGWFWITQPLSVSRKKATPGPAAEPSRLEENVRRIVLDFHPRDFSHPENLDRAASFIGDSLKRVGAEVSEQLFEAGGGSYRNVIGSFGPGTSEVIVVGAHYDTDGEMPGADDNASGVAALLELAPLVAQLELSRRVELVAFALEEMPFFGTGAMGSAVHAVSLRAGGRSVRAMICLEMLGCFDDRRGSQRFPLSFLRLFYPGRGNFIAVVGNLGGAPIVRRVKRSMRAGSELPVYSINAPSLVPGVDLSDHRSYWRQGFPAVMITDTAFYRNDRYHTAADTPETLDYNRMAEVVRGVFRAVTDLAG